MSSQTSKSQSSEMDLRCYEVLPRDKSLENLVLKNHFSVEKKDLFTEKKNTFEILKRDKEMENEIVNGFKKKILSESGYKSSQKNEVKSNYKSCRGPIFGYENNLSYHQFNPQTKDRGCSNVGNHNKSMFQFERNLKWQRDRKQ